MIITIFFAYIIASIIAWTLSSVFNRHQTKLNIIYTIILITGLGYFSFNYWQIHQANTAIVPFPTTSSNHLTYTFIPNYNGIYSFDVMFRNKDIKQIYRNCFYENDSELAAKYSEMCKKSFLFHTSISGDVNNQSFRTKLKYNDVDYDTPLPLYTNYLGEIALRLFHLDNQKNMPVHINIKIDANQKQINSMAPDLVIAPDEDEMPSLMTWLVIFIVMSIPYVLEIIYSLFGITYVKFNSDNKSAYYTPSSLKIIILSLATLGLYEIYWFYKNWQSIKSSGKKCNPALRSIFCIIFSYFCFAHIKKTASSNNIKIKLPAFFLALMFLILTVPSNLPDPYWCISFLSFIPILIANRAALTVNQALIPGFASDSKFSRWNLRIIFLVLTPMVVILIISMCVP